MDHVLIHTAVTDISRLAAQSPPRRRCNTYTCDARASARKRPAQELQHRLCTARVGGPAS